MAKHLILVAGNIGAGKTSLTERLAARLGWQAAYESVADNPYLADFYKDMRVWSFHSRSSSWATELSNTELWPPHPPRPSLTAASTKMAMSSPALCTNWAT